MERLTGEEWRTIHLLAEDASDLEAIAQELGCSVQDVRDRARDLERRGVLDRIVARIRPESVGLPVTAFYVLHVAQNADTYESFERLLRDIDQVEEAHALSGRYDWIVKVRAESLENLQELLTSRMALLPGVVRAETLVVMRSACDYTNVHAATFPLEG